MRRRIQSELLRSMVERIGGQKYPPLVRNMRAYRVRCRLLMMIMRLIIMMVRVSGPARGCSILRAEGRT